MHVFTDDVVLGGVWQRAYYTLAYMQNTMEIVDLSIVEGYLESVGVNSCNGFLRAQLTQRALTV